MNRKLIRINWINFFPGFNEQLCREKVLYGLEDNFEFQFVNDPDVMIVGCYGQEELPAGNYLKVGYYTENCPPDLDNCDWFFGCEYEDLIEHPHYRKRVYGGQDPQLLEGCKDPELALAKKDRFCSFLYSNCQVPIREAFFRALNKRKFVHAPGKSMNNTTDSELCARDSSDWHAAKLRYMNRYKFTIAFENSVRSGYYTEKLTDAFLSNTVPIYFGDPNVNRTFNCEAMIHARDYIDIDSMQISRLPEAFKPFKPFERKTILYNRMFGRTNDLLRYIETWCHSKSSFRNLCDRVLEVDNDDATYYEMLSRPKRTAASEQLQMRYISAWHAICNEASHSSISH